MSLHTILHELLDGNIHPNRRGELHDLVKALPALAEEAEAAEPKLTEDAKVIEAAEDPAKVPDAPAGA